jgi:hypothetical protein
MITRFIGDVHGKFNEYVKVIEGIEKSIQVGDMGVGFIYRSREPLLIDGVEHHDYVVETGHPAGAMAQGNHRFIRGNHDNPGFCRDPEKTRGMWIEDGHVEDNMMFIGGATSIDAAWRVEDVSWWRDEQLSYQELEALTDKYVRTKPEIMVTHECPDIIAEVMLAKYNRRKFEEQSMTRMALQSMWEQHKPKMWIFGHWHMNEDFDVNGTRFMCLNELNFADINTHTLERL